MKAVVFAYHNMGLAGLESLAEASIDIAAVFSHEDDPGENCWFGSVVQWAGERRIPVFCPEDVNEKEWIQKIRGIGPDLIFSFYYRRMLSEDILDTARHGAYNLHGSLLPAYRGRAPVNWVLVNGEKITGVTLHHMVRKADAGDIVGQREVAIDFADTALTLYEKLCDASRALLGELLPLIREGRAQRIRQDLAKGSYFGGRKPRDGRIDWQWPAARIYNLVRAVTDPYPGAFAYLPDGKEIFLWRACPEEHEVAQRRPGAVQLEGDAVFVATGKGRIMLKDITVSGVRMDGIRIFQYFKDKEGIELK
jgi:methionyl-tRNA formyltransferase